MTKKALTKEQIYAYLSSMDSTNFPKLEEIPEKIIIDEKPKAPDLYVDNRIVIEREKFNFDNFVSTLERMGNFSIKDFKYDILYNLQDESDSFDLDEQASTVVFTWKSEDPNFESKRRKYETDVTYWKEFCLIAEKRNIEIKEKIEYNNKIIDSAIHNNKELWILTGKALGSGKMDDLIAFKIKYFEKKLEEARNELVA